jgi:hypothetical protein
MMNKRRANIKANKYNQAYSIFPINYMLPVALWHPKETTV